jgi:hypothetical protein
MNFTSLIDQIFGDMLTFEWRLTYTCLATIIINLPFGYLRGGFRKLSLCWFAAIHLPLPLVIIVRKFHSLELTWTLAPFLLGSYFIGQFLGKKLWNKIPYRKKKYSCAFKKPSG